MANWGDANEDALVQIARRIEIYQDFVAFGEVCRSWQSAAVIDNFRYKSGQIPWLMLPPKIGTNLCDFLIISPSNTTTHRRQVMLPGIHGKKCFSSKGWILTVGQDWSLHLFNPFSSDITITLPRIKTFQNWHDSYLNLSKMHVGFIHKCFLSSSSSSSSSSDYIIVVIYGHLYQLAYSKPGDKAWTTINTWHGRYFDITYHKGQFYAINCKGMVMVFNFKGGDNPTEARQVAQLPSALLQYTFEYCYLLESAGALLIVTRQGMTAQPLTEHSSQWTYGTFGFQVFEVDLNTNTWTEIKDLGNRAIFVGHNSSFSVEVSDISYCKPNSIYFTDDCIGSYFSRRKGGGKDVGIYNLKDGSVISLFRTNLFSRLCPPMWVEQSFK